MADPFLGEIRIFGGNFAPQGWSFCDGKLLPIADNTALFSLLGTTYGGDGQATFALPDLRGRFPLHQSSDFTRGARGGTETVTLTVANLASHNHAPQAATTGTASTPAGNVWAGTSALGQFVEPTTLDETMAAGAMGSAGGSQPHDNMVPYLALNYIIALEGIFPSQS